ncbi:MAG: hypothetical protein IH607_04880, partial [Firmicutes bacterium]|nr:hypothetical protein [Bacillota bacterium]
DTDCNVGNLGTILGVMVGLDAIPEKWLTPVHDFLACSSVIGSMNIKDAPACALEIARLGYAIAGETPSERYRAILDGSGATYHFELPRSTHSFRLQGDGQGVLENTADAAHSGTRSLSLRYTGNMPAEVYQKTFYMPADFHDSRYDPSFSPLLYPGQTVRAYVRSGENTDGLSANLVLRGWDGDVLCASGSQPLAQDSWACLTLKANCPKDSLIVSAGVQISGKDCSTFRIFIDDFDISGSADYRIDFAKERTMVWTLMHREISQMTYLRGIWSLENGWLSASGTSYCEGYTGFYKWGDSEVSTVIRPVRGDIFRLLFRVQGAIRSYAATLKPGKLVLEKNENGYAELSAVPLTWKHGETVTLSASAHGNALRITAGDAVIEFIDEDTPYLYGQIGWGLENGRMLVRHADLQAKPNTK